MMPSLVLIELNAFYDVKIDSDVILCNVQTKINQETLVHIVHIVIHGVCVCNHGDVRNRCVCGIHCCTFLIVISVLHITQCIELFFWMLNGVIYLKQSCFFLFLREQKAKLAVCLGYVAVVFYGINLKSFLWNCLIFTSIHLIFT